MRLGVLNNLRAGRNPRRSARVLSFLSQHPEVVHVETNQGEHVPEALAILAKRNIDILAVNGGDGTLQHTLTEILDRHVFPQEPLLIPLRGGRTNLSALGIGSSRRPVAALATALKAIRDGTLAERIVTRPVLRVEIGPQSEVHYGMVFGTGLIHRAIELTHRLFPEGRAQGVFGSGVVLATLVSRAVLGKANGVLQPDQVAVALDNLMADSQPFFLVLATTLDRLFLRIRPFWGQEAAPVRMTGIAADAKRPAAAAMGILRGRPPAFVAPETGYTSRNVHHLELSLDCGVVLDGEMFAPETGRIVRITADRSVRFVRV
ncbi:MAG: diacylglycerol kinase family protein [Candidatus Binatia bacterium]